MSTISAANDCHGASEFQVGLRRIRSNYRNLGEYLDKATIVQSEISIANINVAMNTDAIMLPKSSMNIDVDSLICTDKTISTDFSIYAPAAASAVAFGSNFLAVETYKDKLANVGMVYTTSKVPYIEENGNAVYCQVVSRETVVNGDIIGDVGSENIKLIFFYLDSSMIPIKTVLSATVSKMIKVSLPFISKARFEDPVLIDPNFPDAIPILIGYRQYVYQVDSLIPALTSIDISTGACAPGTITRVANGTGADFAIADNATLEASPGIIIKINGVGVDKRTIATGGCIDIIGGTSMRFPFDLYLDDVITINHEA